MSKNALLEASMPDAVYVDEAARWARVLTQTESRGPGDLENAWSRLERRYGVPARTFWSLRYRRPKTILVSVYLGMRNAYQNECERQLNRYQHELQIAATLGAAQTDLPKTETVVADPKAPF
jgi:hypothetical protein